MQTSQISRVCRGLGITLNIVGLVVLTWSFYSLHEQRLRRQYYSPDDEAVVATGYLRTSVFVGAGCTLLWLGSLLDKRRKNLDT